ncbi:unnamed protein product [Linum tenue]|uniref:Uncharacterized protein n=1 Tax=Linum tenue TaxID=586396 RepID=A0AAV0IS07_9ROSI|nr:unnamed protein product [Linum tenue]
MVRSSNLIPWQQRGVFFGITQVDVWERLHPI